MTVQILQGDCLKVLKTLPDRSVNCCVTSPPYWGLRNYDMDEQIGLEETPEEFIASMVMVFREVHRILKKNGTLWLNMGDSYASSGVPGKQALDKFGGRLGTGGGKKHSAQFCGRSGTPKGLKKKDLMGMPWAVAFALRADGWYLRQDIIWSKPNPMPESILDRCTKAHEYIFLMSKSPSYYYDIDAMREPHALSSIERLSQDVESQEGSDRAHAGRKTNGKMKAMRGGVSKAGYDEQKWKTRHDGLSRPPMTMKDRAYNELGRNRRSVWEVATHKFSESHFATFPPKLIEPCILAGCPESGTVLDPFFGAGTTGLVADRLNRHCIGIELNPEYISIAENRIKDDSPLFADVSA